MGVKLESYHTELYPCRALPTIIQRAALRKSTRHTLFGLTTGDHPVAAKNL